jgi:Holliday junction resolvasome RuvABC endonuclease subunit
MDKAADNLEPATPDDLADALAFALRHNGRKRSTARKK